MNNLDEFVRMGRVLYEDDKFITLEIAKDINGYIHVNQGDRFLSLVFQANKGPWVPWEEPA